MAAYRPASAPANIINHITVIVDESSSMGHLTAMLIKVFNNLIAHLAAQSRANGQETRITVYFFNSRGTSRCVIYDMDVLRLPKIDGLYSPRGMTALIDTVMLSVEDQRLIPQKYGDHSFLNLALTDGQENDSRRTSAELTRTIESAPENETYGVFVPNQMGVHEAKRHGFPAANISVWDANSVQGMEEVGKVMRDLSDAYMAGRAQGVRGYSASSGGGLFKMRNFTAAEVTSTLTPLSMGAYVMLHVTEKTPIRPFVEACGITYAKGIAFYQLTAPVTVQDYKEVVIEHEGQLYTGEAARQLIGLPDTGSVKVLPEPKPGMTVFFQSTSVNRNLFPGTRLLVMR
jgi:hypothetical protein